jgi:hypothetical protein
MELTPLLAACGGSRPYTKPTIAMHRSIFHSTATRVQGNTAWQERSMASYRETSIAQWQVGVRYPLFKTTASSPIVDDLPVSENRLELLSKKLQDYRKVSGVTHWVGAIACNTGVALC